MATLQRDTDAFWTSLGYDNDGDYRVPCHKAVPECPDFHIFWTRDSFGTYEFRLIRRGAKSHGSVCLRVTRDEEMSFFTMQKLEERLVAAAHVLFA
jgi:hypothetical protein